MKEFQHLFLNIVWYKKLYVTSNYKTQEQIQGVSGPAHGECTSLLFPQTLGKNVGVTHGKIRCSLSPSAGLEMAQEGPVGGCGNSLTVFVAVVKTAGGRRRPRPPVRDVLRGSGAPLVPSRLITSVVEKDEMIFHFKSLQQWVCNPTQEFEVETIGKK